MIRRIRAANTGNVVGFRVGKIVALHGSKGTLDRYRNGYSIGWRGRIRFFIPTTRVRSLKW